MRGFVVYRGFDNDPDLFCGWRWSETDSSFYPKWASEEVAHGKAQNIEVLAVPVMVFDSRLNAIKAGVELLDRTDEKRIEVMDLHGGPITFDLRERLKEILAKQG